MVMTSKFPEKNQLSNNNTAKDIAEYLTCLRLTGPHLLFEIRHPEFNNLLSTSEYTPSVFASDPLIAVGVLPLIEITENNLMFKFFNFSFWYFN